MARRYTQTEGTDDLAGTVEGQSRDHFEREKAAYEARTGIKVEFVPPMPTTRTPIAPAPVEPAETEEPTPTTIEGDE